MSCCLFEKNKLKGQSFSYHYCSGTVSMKFAKVLPTVAFSIFLLLGLMPPAISQDVALGPTVMLYGTNKNANTRVLPPPMQEPAPRDHHFSEVQPQISVNYSDEFPFPVEAKAAFQYAVNIWASLIRSPMTIRIDAHFKDLGGASFFGFGNVPLGDVRPWTRRRGDNKWYAHALADKLDGKDWGNGAADMIAKFNSNRDAKWYFGTDGKTPSGKYDFVTVVLHELGHGLGFQGVADIGTVRQDKSPGIYDSFVVNGAGTHITTFPDPSTALQGQLTGDNLFWNGAEGIKANTRTRPKLYAPNPWEEGSSYSHLDEETFKPGNLNSLMTPITDKQESIHHPGPITLGMLKDMGWTINSAPEVVGLIAPRTLTVGSAITVDIAPYFSDPENDVLTYTARSNNTGVATTNVSGSVVTITPRDEGRTTVTVAASDGVFTVPYSILVTVTAATVQNQAPIPVDTIFARALTVGGSSTTLDVSGNFSDPDNDPLTYSAQSDNTSIARVSRSGSEVTITPTGEGSVQITVTAADPGGLIATQTIDVTVQAEHRCEYTLSQSSLDVPASGGPLQIDVTTTSSCDWNATTSSYFLSVSPSSVTGSGTVRVTVDANTGTRSRTGTIRVAGETFRVRQDSMTTIASQELSRGDAIIVQNTLSKGLFIRPDAGKDPEIGAVFDGATGTIIGGPRRTVDGLTWWKVEWDYSNKVVWYNRPHNDQGWSAEAIDEDLLILRRPPDLAIESFRVSESTVDPGEEFTLSLTVRNKGYNESEPATLHYYYSSTSEFAATDLLGVVGKDSVGRLDPDDTSKEQISAKAPLTPGTYYYGVFLAGTQYIDDGNPLNDDDPRNNFASEKRVKVRKPTFPDLVVESPSVSEDTLAPGENFRLSATVRNRGSGESRSTTLRYYRSSNSTISTDDTQVETDGVSSLDPDETDDESATLRAPNKLGVYYYGACVDSVIGESNTNNNCSSAQRITVTVEEVPREAQTLVKISGDNQQGAPGTTLANSLIVEVQDANGNPFEGILVTFAITAGGGSLSTQTATTNANGQASTTLTLGSNAVTNTVEVSVTGISASVRFTAIAQAPVGEAGDIPDPNLRAAIEKALGKASGAPITPAEMATLTRLEAQQAGISDLTGLESATNLTDLFLKGNSISDISPLSGLTQLTGLGLNGNDVTDISLLSGLTQLTLLTLGANDITDAAPVAGLTNLTALSLYGNDITDISVLSGLTNLTRLYLRDNNITDISPLSGLTQLTLLTLDNNDITDISPLVVNTGLGSGDTVNVRGNPLSSVSIQTHIPTLQSRGVTVEFDDVVVGEPGDIPDPNLRAAIEKALDKASGTPITSAEMATLTRFHARNVNIRDLTGLERATNLIELGLDGEFVGDIWRNSNSISNISSLSGLTGLENLWLGGNSISAISPLAGLTNLTWLTLEINNISDISPLSGLTNLTELVIFRNNISDISPLSGLTNLTKLRLEQNLISSISVLSDLPNLTELMLRDNNITDLSPLVANTGLGNGDRVDVRGNPLNNASIQTYIPTLQSRGVTVEFDDVVVGEPGDIPDPNLRAAIEKALDKAPGTPITSAEMATLTLLDAPNTNIRNLTGLEAATNLARLFLGGESGGGPIITGSSIEDIYEEDRRLINSNSISDLSPLAGLINLESIELWSNSIADISPLAGLTNLERLAIWDNFITDISPVAGLTNLTELAVGGNLITDLTPVAGLPNLTNLHLPGNPIADISPVAGMTQLTRLYLGSTNITNLSFLSGLTNLTFLTLDNNSISDISPVAGLTNLTELFIWRTPIADISPLAGLTNLTILNLQDNNISDLSPLVENTGLDEGDEVYVQGNPLNYASIHTYIPALQSRGVIVEFDISVDIPDPNLRAAIEKALGKASGAPITTTDMATLTDLDARNANISDLTGLENATNLTWLVLGGEYVEAEGHTINSNSVSDLSPLSGLTNLTELWLEHNAIIDISPVVGLTNLTRLELGGNTISDISAVAGLINLTGLGLWENNISDISVVSGLTNLTGLWLWDNAISDISPAAGLTDLTYLALGGNNISDISAVSGLTNLMELHLPGNNISDISVVSGLTNLKWLNLNGTNISDLSPLVANTGLGDGDEVYVRGNPLSSVSTHTHIPALQSRGVTVEFDISVDIPDPNLRAAIEKALGKASGAPITTTDMATLTDLDARNANISDLTGLENATNLTWLVLGGEYVEAEGHTINSNSVSDLSPLSGLTNLTELWLEHNAIIDISPVVGLTNLTRLELGGNTVSDISAVAGLTNLTGLGLWENNISDISVVSGLTNLTGLWLWYNSISDISVVSGLTNLTRLDLENNAITDISPLAGLTDLIYLALGGNNISDISSLAGLTSLAELWLWNNAITDLAPVSGLTNLTWLALGDNSIADISLLVANTGLGSGDTVDVSENPLNSASIHTHIPTLQSRGVEVRFDNLKPTTLEYLLSIPSGISLIHVPLKVAEVDGVAQTIESIADLYDALGGASTVNFLITYDSSTQEWLSYFVPSDKGTPADRALTDDMGIIAGLRNPTSVRLSGDALGIDGSSTITLNQGLNFVGLPLRDSRITRVSDLFTLDGIGGNVPVVILTDNGEFKIVGQARDPGDIEITGGQSFIMTAQRAVTVAISGEGWTNTSGSTAAPPVTLKGIEVRDTTPVLALRGSIVDEEADLKVEGFRVTVKNLSTRRAIAAITASDEAGYRLTIVDIEMGRAATIGDILEIFAQSPNPFIGVKPLRYTITAEDVKQSWIQLPELVAYEIPAETQLLANYPNPFNPETWIPYRLAEDTFVTLTIYDQTGQVVRTLDVGHQIAAVYENRSQAIYWAGRNNVGEQVASGVYFYHLSAGDFSATRKMLILK